MLQIVRQGNFAYESRRGVAASCCFFGGRETLPVSDKNAVKRPHRPNPKWPGLLGVAALSSLATLFVSRNFFPPEKKVRSRITADYHPGDDTFLRTMGNVLGPPVLPGNDVRVLQNGEEIFPAMLSAIRSAERTITFENFLFAEGRVSDEFAEALAERARAGVTVHFLQDAMGTNAVRGRAITLLKRAGVQVEIFRFVHFTSINSRTHRKILVLDGKLGFIGGVGISDDWDGDGRTPGKWRDTHYQVEGPVVAQLQQAFIDNWLQTRAELLHGDLYFPKLERAGKHKCQIFKSSAGEGSDSARLMLLVSIAAARESIRIANAYFIPDDLCRSALIEALRRGVRVEIITPGPDFDAPTVQAVGRSRWKPLFEAGARFFEYQPARFHCKYLLVDDCWASVGSANLDNRSLSLNEEANLNILDGAWVRAHARIFEEDKSHSREITLRDWHRRPWREKIKGRLASIFRQQL